MNDILVVAVHPDDETLGAGGTLLRHKAQGDRIHWLILTSMYFRDGLNNLLTLNHNSQKITLPEIWKFPAMAQEFLEKRVTDRALEIQEVSRAYRFDSVTELFIPTTGFSEQAEVSLIARISNEISKIKPQSVYLPFYADVHGDHQAAFLVIYSSLKPFRAPFVKNIYMMETISETEYALPVAGNSFLPNRFVNIDDWFEEKMEILKIYTSELGEPPMPRNVQSIRSLALLRGTFSQCKFAEAFMILRELV